MNEHEPVLGVEYVKVWSSEYGVVKAYVDTEYYQEWINLDSVGTCFNKTKEDIVRILEDGIKAVPSYDEGKPLKVYWTSTNGTEVIPYDYLWRLVGLLNK